MLNSIKLHYLPIVVLTAIGLTACGSAADGDLSGLAAIPMDFRQIY